MLTALLLYRLQTANVLTFNPILALTVSDVCLKLGCFQSTSTYSALEVSHFINSRLTYLHARHVSIIN